MQLVAAFVLTMVLRAGPDAGQPSAEAELEALLATTTPKSPPAEVLVVVEGPDPKVYRLEEATVHLDGVPLALSVPADAGSAPSGTPLSDGDHIVSARLVYRGQPTGPYPWEEGPRWALPARVSLQASHGLRFTIRFVVETNSQAQFASQRLGLRADVNPEMMVAVDDAPLPPPPLPKLPPPAAETPVATSIPPAEVAPDTPPATAPAKKKAKKKVARASRTTAGVPAAAAVSKGAAAVPTSTDNPDALEQATARLRSALASPTDAGVAPSGAVPR